MRKIILMMSVSIDGFFEGPDRDISWHLVDEELHQHFNDECRAMGAFLDGRITHELMAEFWPTADQDPDSTAAMAEFAGIWRDMPKFVFSRTLTTADWNTKVIHDVVPEEIAQLKAQPGGDLGLGGANLAATFMAARPHRRIPALRPPRGAGPGASAVPVTGRQDEPQAGRDADLRQRSGPAPLRARPGLTGITRRFAPAVR